MHYTVVTIFMHWNNTEELFFFFPDTILYGSPVLYNSNYYSKTNNPVIQI